MKREVDEKRKEQQGRGSKRRRKRGRRERMRLWRDGWINPEIDCRITAVILGGVRARTATSSLFPSVISLADELLWLFQPGCITLYSTFLYHSVQFNVEKGGKKYWGKAKLKTVALCARSLWAEVITKWQEVFLLQGVWGELGVGVGRKRRWEVAVCKGTGDSRYKYSKKPNKIKRGVSLLWRICS